MANKKLTQLPAISSVSNTTIFLVDDTGTTQTANGTVVKNFITSNDMTVTGNVTASYFIGNGSQLTGVAADTATTATSLVNGSSNVTVATNGNINLSVGGTSNVLHVTNSNATVTGDLVITGNISVSGITNSVPRPYGTFANVANITAVAANTAYAIQFSTAISNSQVSLGVNGPSNSHIIVNQTGKYLVDYNALATATGGGSKIGYFWLRKNGTDVPNSATEWQTNNNGDIIPVTANFTVDLAANDYIEIIYAVSSTNFKLLYTPEQTTPFAMPASPSIIMNIRKV